ncbi:hypothetical protein RQP46_005857 [Phenoliferia psychrophenolica]
MDTSDRGSLEKGDGPRLHDSINHKTFGAASVVDPELEKRTLRKVDWVILPLMTLLFLLNYIDRTAIGNANVAGLSKDLKLSVPKYEYNIGLMVFFILYIAVEIPSNLALKKYGGKWLSLLVIGFGIVSIATAFIHNFAEFVVMRGLLGAFEGGVLPAIAFLMSRFYRRHEFVLRLAVMQQLGPNLSGAFGGLLAAGLLGDFTIGSVVSWRKIFLVEGILTTAIGFASLLIVPTHPSTANFLSPEERICAVQRLEVDQVTVDGEEPISFASVMRQLKSINLWLTATIYAFVLIIVQGTGLFLPTVIRTLGKFTTVETQLRTVSVYAVGCIWALLVSYGCMRTRRHGVWIIMTNCIAVVGYILFLATTNKAVLYFAVHLGYAGLIPTGPIVLAWCTSNAGSELSRVVSVAFIASYSTWGSILSTWIYLPKYAPRYIPGNSVNVAAVTMNVVLTAITVMYIRGENKKRDLGERDHRLVGKSTEEINRLGRHHPAYRMME